MKNLDAFTKQYLVAALWSSTDDSEAPLDEKFGLSDISEECTQQAIEDCEKFRVDAGNILDDYDDETSGLDFWLTRNHHGAGFWDGDYGKENGEALTKIAQKFPELFAYVGDDGKVWLS